MKRILVPASLLALGLLAACASPGPGDVPPYGPGMMGEYGPAASGEYGSRFGGVASLRLTLEQAQKIAVIEEETRRRNWAAIGEMHSETFELRRLYLAESVDPGAIAEQRRKVDRLRRDLLRSYLEAQKQIEDLLTTAQRKQFRAFRPWWMWDMDELG